MQKELRFLRRGLAFYFLAAVLCWVVAIVFEYPTNTQSSRPYWTNQCLSPRPNFNVVSTVSCTMANVVAGQTVIVDGSGAATSITLSSPTETLTCPAGAAGGDGTNSWNVRKCYVVLASNHGTFTVTATSSGGFNRVFGVGARAYVGLGTYDTQCASGGSSATSCSLTTGNSGEWLDVTGADLANDLSPQTGFFQQQYGATESDTSSQQSRIANWYKITGGAGSQTAQYTSTNSFPRASVAAMAFQVSSPPLLPAVVLLQTCDFAYANTTRSQGSCPLHNYTANDQIIYAIATWGDTSLSSTFGTSTSCPASALSFHTYSSVSYGTGICTASTNSNQSSYQVGAIVHTGSGQTLLFVHAGEYSGTTGVVDTGSEAATNALSTSYTTASANEFTFTACFDNGANPLSPASSEIQSGNGVNIDTSPNADQFEVITKTTSAAGSNTTSCSMTSSSRPMIATTSIGIAATNTTRPRARVIRFRKIPWDDRRQRSLQLLRA